MMRVLFLGTKPNQYYTIDCTVIIFGILVMSENITWLGMITHREKKIVNKFIDRIRINSSPLLTMWPHVVIGVV